MVGISRVDVVSSFKCVRAPRCPTGEATSDVCVRNGTESANLMVHTLCKLKVLALTRHQSVRFLGHATDYA